MQSQVRFNRVPEKVPEKVPGSLGAKPSQGPNGFRRRLQRRSQARFYVRSFLPPCRLWGIYSYGLNGMSGKLTAERSIESATPSMTLSFAARNETVAPTVHRGMKM